MSDLGPDLDAAPQGEPVTPGRSTIDRIRDRHAQGRKPLFLAIPAWDGDVVVQFGPVSKKKLVAAAKSKTSSGTAATLLASACVEVFVLDEHGERVPARDPRVGGDGQPEAIRFDGRLARLFRLGDGLSPAGIVMAMYGDDVALVAHAQRVHDWQTGKDLDEIDLEEVDELAGEADAAT